jgi:hypothetical protein
MSMPKGRFLFNVPTEELPPVPVIVITNWRPASS